MTSIVSQIRRQWAEAASDGVVTNIEVRTIYGTATENGVCVQALSALDDIVDHEIRLHGVYARVENERYDRRETARAALSAGETQSLPAPQLKKLRDAFSAADAASREGSEEEEKDFQVMQQAKMLRKMVRDETDAQGLFSLSTLYANVKEAFASFRLSGQ